MAASGGLVSIRVLMRQGVFQDLKRQHLGLISCWVIPNRNQSIKFISSDSSQYVLGNYKLTSSVRLKSIQSFHQCQPIHTHAISRRHCCLSSLQCHQSKLKKDDNHRYLPLSFNFISARNFHRKNNCSHCTPQNDTAASELSSDPFQMVEKEMANLPNDIKAELSTNQPLLKDMSHYYFNGKGKSFRPLVALLMAKACNIHSSNDDSISWSQKIVAMVAEMIHTASLVHDDVIDSSDTRRGQASLNRKHGQRQSILAGDYILSQASIALASIGNAQVICILSSILEDLVSGEFMQLGSKEDENERFAHYLQKTFKKTASLIANTCKSAAILSGCNEDIAEAAFQYGRNLGIAFQLVDDLLDFTACESDMGKPTAADLKLGLATAPVLFAAQEHPELHSMIMRRFTEVGDVEHARQMVAKSDGVEQTRMLAAQHSKEAIRNIEALTTSSAQRGLIQLAHVLLERQR